MQEHVLYTHSSPWVFEMIWISKGYEKKKQPQQRGLMIGFDDFPHQYHAVARRRPCNMLQGSQGTNFSPLFAIPSSRVFWTYRKTTMSNKPAVQN